MEQQFSGIKFQKIGYTSRGCDRVPEIGIIGNFRFIQAFLLGLSFAGWVDFVISVYCVENS